MSGDFACVAFQCRNALRIQHASLIGLSNLTRVMRQFMIVEGNSIRRRCGAREQGSPYEKMHTLRALVPKNGQFVEMRRFLLGRSGRMKAGIDRPGLQRTGQHAAPLGRCPLHVISELCKPSVPLVVCSGCSDCLINTAARQLPRFGPLRDQKKCSLPRMSLPTRYSRGSRRLQNLRPLLPRKGPG